MSDLLSVLCPMFKDEVYRRTARIGNITMFGGAGLIVSMLWYPAWAADFGGLQRLLCGAGVVVFVAALVHQVSREAARHDGAKEALIRIERALGLFEPGRHTPAAALYPEEWMTPPPRARATRAAQVVLSLLGILFVMEIVLT